MSNNSPGGKEEEKLAVVYTRKGFKKKLRRLNNGRYNHDCSSFRNQFFSQFSFERHGRLKLCTVEQRPLTSAHTLLITYIL